MCQELDEMQIEEYKRFNNRDGVHHPYVPNWSEILPPPPPIELPPPIPSVSSSQIIKISGSNPQSPKINPKKSLQQTQNVSFEEFDYISLK